MTRRPRSATVGFLVLLAISFHSTVRADAAPPLLLQVKDHEGRPIAGAAVRAAWRQDDPAEREPVFRSRTSPRGTLRLNGLPADREVWIYLSKAGFTPEIRSLSAADAPRELAVTLRPGSAAFGRVVDEEGRPVEGAKVELSGLPSGLPGWEIPPGLADLTAYQARSSRAGRFRFPDLPAGEFWMIIRHPGLPVLIVQRPVEGGTTSRLGTFVLRRGVTLRGTVTDAAGHPVVGARVWVPVEHVVDLPPASAVTGAGGRFAVPDLPPKTALSLWVCAEDFLQEEEILSVPDEPVRVTLKPAAMVRGRVIGPDGAPLPGATVRAIPAHYNPGIMRVMAPACPPEWSVTADAEGRFAFGRLEPGRHKLVATAADLRPGSSDSILLEAGTPGEDVEIQLQKGAAVTGRVLDPAGEPLPGVRLTTWIGPIEIVATSGADGAFRLAGIPPGNLQINVWAKRFQTRRVEVDVRADEVTADVVLEPE